MTDETTGLSLIVEWANAQDHWVRALVAEVIETRKGITDEGVGRFYDMLLKEKSLADGEPVLCADLAPNMEPGDKEQALALLTLKDVQGVNALASGQEIDFNRRMTVLFGENGTGKTGYVRILKMLASVRTAEAILADVTKPGPQPEPQAHLAYQLGDDAEEHRWRGEKGVHPFTRIDVFDSRGVLIHVDDDLAYAYIPSDLALFRLVHDALDAVKDRLDAARKAKLPKGNLFVARFSRNSTLRAKIEALGASTNLEELKRLAEVPEEESQQLDALRELVDALKSKGVEGRLELATNEKALYQQVRDALGAFERFDCDLYHKSLDELSTARADYALATRESLASEDIPGVLADAWRAFVEAGEAYRLEVEDPTYPSSGDRCLYCRQPLEAAALGLLTKYREFSNNTFKQSVDKATQSVGAASKEVLGLDVERLKQELERKLKGQSGDEKPEALDAALDFVVAALAMSNVVSAGERLDAGWPTPIIASCRRLVDARFTEASTLAATLSTERDNRKKRLEEETARLIDLESRLTLRELMPAIREHVEAAQWADRARAHATPFRNLTRSLTDTSKVASAQMLNPDFERGFQAECEALRAPEVTLKFPGQDAEGLRRKTIVPDHKLSEILSEGEQKVIALADFIAEASLRESASPMLLDDPVNSLDYRRLDYVAERLVRLSETRQVIVFTHNIWFATELLSHFEDDTELCAYYDVAETGESRGVVTRGSHPRWDTFKKTKGKINRLIQDARSASSAEVRDALVENAYGFIRNIAETVVEQELLCGVTQRYAPHVAMTKLPQIKSDRLADAVGAILPIFQKACRIFEGHSQPLERLHVKSSLEDLEADWKTLQAARDAYLA